MVHRSTNSSTAAVDHTQPQRDKNVKPKQLISCHRRTQGSKAGAKKISACLERVN